MCKFPFSCRGFVAGVRARRPTCWPRPSPHAQSGCGGHSLCEIAAATPQRRSSACASRSTACRSATREAMLAGRARQRARSSSGAYVDDHGGVCPMLAAHRCGGRTDFLSFAKSWDRFTRARAASARRPSASCGSSSPSSRTASRGSSGLELDRAIAEHRALRRQAPARAPSSSPIRPIRGRDPRRQAAALERATISADDSAGADRTRPRWPVIAGV